MKTHELAFVIVLFSAAVLLTIKVTEHQKAITTQSDHYKAKADYYQQQADSLMCRVREWENHAIRMRRIVGVPDSVEWSYATKCKYSIDTKKAFRNGRGLNDF